MSKVSKALMHARDPGLFFQTPKQKPLDPFRFLDA